MATAKKGAKSNKTAHVLNLLTAPGGEKETPAVDAPQVPPAETDAVPPQAEVTEGPSLPLAPPILEVARSNDAQISLQIKDALESELLAEAGLTPAADSAPEPAAEPIPQPAPEPIPEPEPEPIPEPKPEPKPAPKPDPDELVVVNVMESLVEAKAPRYINMFGLCPCKRCTVDVKALTLTNLQPAYIVVRRAEVNGMLTVYESRFNSTIFAQLTKACKVVMDHPRHDKDDIQ